MGYLQQYGHHQHEGHHSHSPAADRYEFRFERGPADRQIDLAEESADRTAMSFGRAVAIGKMTVKNLASAESVLGVKFTAPDKKSHGPQLCRYDGRYHQGVWLY